ncbi:hypothetical protein ADIMK_4006 [Marinobacterium lacunae]|uniref:Uncharacterized protein n=1 Tax=Marinobacterium lacunae TaxID=1232683 RepID=A0A081FTK4_9GAMM|nr:hypothetical protein ADIMK_4006 [Marinobacterium lacunae]
MVLGQQSGQSDALLFGQHKILWQRRIQQAIRGFVSKRLSEYVLQT